MLQSLEIDFTFILDKSMPRPTGKKGASVSPGQGLKPRIKILRKKDLKDADDLKWELKFKELIAFKAIYGHCIVSVPERQPPIPLAQRKLATWVRNQRSLYNRGLLLAERKNKLDGIGFCWDKAEAQWHEMYTQLFDFFQKNGHSNVITNRKEGDLEATPQNIKLGSWVNTQRMCYKNGQMSAEHKELLDLLHFSWSRNMDIWEKHFKNLQLFFAKHGHCVVPQDSKEFPGLARFVHKLRHQNRHRLTLEELKILESINFVWDYNEYFWQKNFAKYKEYLQQHGCHPVLNFKVENQDLELQEWIHRMRAAKKKLNFSLLTPQRLKLLNEIGFIWDAKEWYWNKMYEELLAYMAENAGLSPTSSKKIRANTELNEWAKTQRKNRAIMPLDKRKKLESCGFEWDTKKAYLGHEKMRWENPEYREFRKQVALKNQEKILEKRKQKKDSYGDISQ
jgi:hypothetical protein